jgi:hypothetical protein
LQIAAFYSIINKNSPLEEEIIMKDYLIVAMLCMSAIQTSVHAISSIRGITAVIKNETPQEFIVKLVNLESSQEVLVEVLNAKGMGRDVIRMIIPPELYSITIFYPPNNKTTEVSAKALRGILPPNGFCAQITLRPRIYIGEPQIELSAPSNCG